MERIRGRARCLSVFVVAGVWAILNVAPLYVVQPLLYPIVVRGWYPATFGLWLLHWQILHVWLLARSSGHDDGEKKSPLQKLPTKWLTEHKNKMNK